jgi:hypothetical protein
MFKEIMKLFLISLLLLFFSACGYKPSAKYSRAIVGDKISTSVEISSQDPENTVLIKDAVDTAVIEIFHASLVHRNISQTHLELSISEPSYRALQYDSDGFIVAYRTTINLRIKRYREGSMKVYKTQGTYDFSIVANAVITDQERFNAINFSSQKAIRSFIAQVSAEGARVKEEK